MKLILAICVLLSACGSAGTKTDTMPNSNTNDEGPVSFTELYKGQHCGFETPKMEVFNDSKELEAVIAEINKTQTPGLMAPEIDFSKFQVAFLTAGERTSGGYSIVVDAMERTDNSVLIHYKNTFPQPGNPVTMALTSPWTMIKFEKQTLPVVFSVVNN